MQNEKTLLPPPWIAHPEVARYSIGGQMSCDEDYIDKWYSWQSALSREERKTYQKLFPEPVTWEGYWDYEDRCIHYEQNGFSVDFWREDGEPKYTVRKLQAAYLKGQELTYTMFWKPLPSPDGQLSESCLGQWWMSDFWSVDYTYCCMEQYMMAAKAKLFGDEKTRWQILQCSDPKQIKALGRKVKNFDETLWNEVKYSIVLNGNYLKFTQNPELRNFLLSTGDSVLTEASPLDSIWGIKMAADHEYAQDPFKWRGKNLLGFALMEVRDEIRRVWEHADLCEPVSKTSSQKTKQAETDS